MLLKLNFKILFALIALCLIVIEARPNALPQQPYSDVIIEDGIDDALPYESLQVDPDSFPLTHDVPDDGIGGIDDYHIRK